MAIRLNAVGRREFEFPTESLVRVSVCFLYRQRLVSDEAKAPLSAPRLGLQNHLGSWHELLRVYSATRRYQKPAENLSILLNNQNNGSMLEG